MSLITSIFSNVQRLHITITGKSFPTDLMRRAYLGAQATCSHIAVLHLIRVDVKSVLRLFLVLLLVLQSPTASAGDLKGTIRVAVMPFETPKSQPDIKQYGAGTMDSLIQGLQYMPQLIMVDRTRVDRLLNEQNFTHTGLDAAVKVGKILGAQVLINGSIQMVGSADQELVITAQIVDVASGEIRSTHKVQESLRNIFDLQEKLVNVFLKDQNIKATLQQQSRIEKVLKSTASLIAYDYYATGRKAFLQFNQLGYEKAVKCYHKAIEADPTYALAYAGLAEVWNYWGYEYEQNRYPYESESEQAYGASQKALQLNPDLPDAHQAFGIASRKLGKSGYQEALRRALSINPNVGETWSELWIGSGNGTNPDHEYIRKALELNPDLPAARHTRGVALYNRQRYEEALAEFQTAIRITPCLAGIHYDLGRALSMLGKREEAADEYSLYLQYAQEAGDRALVMEHIRRLRAPED